MAVVASVSLHAAADAALRVMTYNIDADTTDHETDGVPDATKMTAILQAIGNQVLAGNKQAVDVIAFQELYKTPGTTLAAVAADLNTLYSTNTYTYDTTIGNSNGSIANSGNGSSGLIYNSATVGLVGNGVIIGSVDSNGASRTPIRYQLQAKSAATNNTFYLYTEHTKADSGATNAQRRAYEVDSVRADADKLAAGSHIIYTGDFNLAGSTNGTTTSGSNEAAYKDLTAASGTKLTTNGDPNSSAAVITAGSVGQAFDPVASTFANGIASQVKYYTESDVNVNARFDLQLLSGNMLAANNQAGLQLVPNSEIAFGNSYYVNGVLTSALTVGGSVTDSTANGLSSTVLTDLTQISDHLPVVADYVIATVPEPTTLAGVGVLAVLGLRRRGTSAAQ